MNAKPNVLILEARFYDSFADGLVAGADRVLAARGASYERVTVPGTFELPAAVGFASRATTGPGGRCPYDGFVALGCVIRGETSHYEHVCDGVTQGLQDLAVNHGLALGFGVVTAENADQARRRSDPDDRDAGGAAARACLAMIDLAARFRG